MESFTTDRIQAMLMITWLKEPDKIWTFEDCALFNTFNMIMLLTNSTIK